MGNGYTYRCTECDYSFQAVLGVGFRFPTVYRSTVEGARMGGLGKEIKKIFEENPDAAINCDATVIRCEKCGDLSCAAHLGVYIPKVRRDAAPKYVAPWALNGGYTLLAKYPHRCRKCGSPAETIDEKAFSEKIQDGRIACPCCGARLKFDESSVIMWD